MQRRDMHARYDFFQYVRADDGVPPPDRDVIDVAVLDMNHSWPNVGHDSIVHALLEETAALAPSLRAAGLRVRVLSYDVRRRLAIPADPNGRFALYVGTGGPGHLDPRQNDGKQAWSQGIVESAAWESRLFHLFDAILGDERAALVGICHTFGLLCRWSGIAHPELRETKSSGMPTNVLSAAADDHPWFAEFGRQLGADRHFRVVDNRLFDLVLDRGDITPISFESEGSGVITAAEFARSEGMPRVFGVNHHPEIIDREHLLAVLDEKFAKGEVSEAWYQERSHTLENDMRADAEQQSRLTSKYMLLGILQAHLRRAVEERSSAALARES